MTITLATLKDATAQQVFDQIATHLLTQNKKCFATKTVSSSCAYRNNEGLKCAAGCLMSNEEAAQIKKDDKNIWGWTRLIQNRDVPECHAALIRKTQQVHDSSAIRRWAEELEAVAKGENLSPAVLEKFRTPE